MITYKPSIDRTSVAILRLELIYTLQARIAADVFPWIPIAMAFTLCLEAMNKATTE